MRRVREQARTAQLTSVQKKTTMRPRMRRLDVQSHILYAYTSVSCEYGSVSLV